MFFPSALLSPGIPWHLVLQVNKFIDVIVAGSFDLDSVQHLSSANFGEFGEFQVPHDVHMSMPSSFLLAGNGIIQFPSFLSTNEFIEV